MRMKETLARLAALGATLGLSACALIYDLSDYHTAGAGGTGPDGGPGSGPGSGSGESSSAGSGPDPAVPAEVSFQLGGAGRDTVVGMDVDGAGNIFVVGSVEGPFMSDDLPYTINEDEVGLVLVKLDPSGKPLWKKLIAVSSEGTPLSADLAVTPDGRAAITGSFGANNKGWVDLGKGPEPGFGESNGFVTMLDSGGSSLWGRRFGTSKSHAGTGVAVDASGKVAITGFFSGEPINLGDPLDPTCLISNSKSSMSPLVATFDQTGKCLWSRPFDASGDASGDKVAIDSGGNVIVTGYLADSLSLDAVGMLHKESLAASDGFLIKLNANSTVAFGLTVGPEARARVTTDADDTIILSGAVQGALYHDTTMTYHGGVDMMAASFSSAGDPNWAHAYGGAEDDTLALAVDPAGGLVVAGSIQSAVTWGGEMVMSAGGADAFLGSLDGKGNPNGSAVRFGGADDQAIAVVRLDKAGNRIVAGQFKGSLNLGKEPLASGGDFDIFVARLPPASP